MNFSRSFVETPRQSSENYKTKVNIYHPRRYLPTCATAAAYTLSVFGLERKSSRTNRRQNRNGVKLSPQTHDYVCTTIFRVFDIFAKKNTTQKKDHCFFFFN